MRKLFTGFFILSAILMQAQIAKENTIPCIFDEITQQVVDQDPDLHNLREQAEQIINSTIQREDFQPDGAVQTIPVVFHILYYNDYDNISEAQVLDGLRILNEDWSKTNPDANQVRSIFASRQANMEVQFELAKIDPNGNCTNGITRTQTSLTLNAYNNVKSLIRWDNTRYLNVWVVRNITFPGAPGTILGFSSFPGDPASNDGIVIRHDVFGRIGTSSSQYGRTLSHEVGHYLGLYHPFQGGCNGGDACNDTPPVANASYGCSMTKNSCSESPDLPDMIENFMDYANDNCQNTFTNDQKNRAKGVLAGIRSNIWSNTNLTLTGIIGTPVCSPSADFTLDRKIVCTGEPVKFTSLSQGYNNPTLTWNFGGGNQLGGTNEEPEVGFPNPGFYTVALTISNNQGTDTETKTDVIRVFPKYQPISGGIVEGFENTFPGNNWFIDSDLDPIEWQVTTDAAFSGSKSLVLRNGNNPSGSGTDALVSAPVESMWLSNFGLTFKYAFAKKLNSDKDLLKVEISQDCGETWQLIRIISSNSLATSGNTGANFIPTNTSQWNTSTVDMSAHRNKGTILIRLKFESGGGNHIYLDDINLNQVLGEDELPGISEVIYPNPTDGKLQWRIQSQEISSASIEVADITGRVFPLQGLNEIRLTNRMQTLDIDLGPFAPGVYFIRLKTDRGTLTKRVIKQ
ncbi:MAG: T9SS type A sorting domain-containing protein [Bacteroidota bacterium]|nr:T9SS type A sorting domain-containing protein [Bacteroidota bacterium]MDX5404973.1 T9SS type A sorting domain-containing protein [Bacteroidota bacterium]